MRAVDAAIRRGLRADSLMLAASQLDDFLAKHHVTPKATPIFEAQHSFDGKALEEAVVEEINYLGNAAVGYDLRSIQAIAQLRMSSVPTKLENCKAVLVTSNRGLAVAARRFANQHERMRHVGPVITDLTLTNHAWLKCPLESVRLPGLEVLALCASTLAVSPETWKSFLGIAEEMAQTGRVDPRAIDAFRLDPEAESLLSEVSLGGTLVLGQSSVLEVMERYRESITSGVAAVKDEEIHEISRQLERERRTGRLRKGRVNREARSAGRVTAWLVKFGVGLALLVKGAVHMFDENASSGYGFVTLAVVWFFISPFLSAFGFNPVDVAKWSGACVEKFWTWLRNGNT